MGSTGHPLKTSLRAAVRKVLAQIPPDERAAASAGICRLIGSLGEWAAARTVASFAAQKAEPDLAPLLEAGGKTFCFPKVSGEALEFRQCASRALLAPGPWNLAEPDPLRCPLIDVANIDLLLIPGLAFTRSGLRLGRGGGYYDRFLAWVHPAAVKIGVCFHAQIVEAVPSEIHDREVDVIVTETEIIRCQKG